MPDAFVHTHGQGFKVHPPVVWRRRDDGFQFGNGTKWPVTIQFPDGVVEPSPDFSSRQSLLQKVFPEPLATILAESFPVAPHGRADFTFITKEYGEIEYVVTVYTDHGPVDAPGCSPPKIIIEP